MNADDASRRQAFEGAAAITFANESTERARLTSRQRSLAVDAAVALSSAVALAHAVATPDQWHWWAASGVFFALIAIAQGALAVGLLRKPVRDNLLLVGVWGTVSVIAVYVMSRTAGLPLAPPALAHGSRWMPGRSIVPGGKSHLNTFEIATLVVEIVLIMILTGLMTRALRQRTASHLLWIGLVLWGLAGLSML